MSEITRGTYAHFGTAVRKPRLGRYCLAWACEGETVAEGPLGEPNKAYFQLADSEAEALEKLHAELKRLLN